MAGPTTSEAIATHDVRRVAALTLVGGGVALSVLVASIALWEGRTVFLLLFLAYTLAAAIRPSVDALARRGIPRALALAAHALALVGVFFVLALLFVPVALDQTRAALDETPSAASGRGNTLDSVKVQALQALEARLSHLAEPGQALSTLTEALTVAAAVAFTLAAAAYWVFERDRLVNLVLALLPHERRKTARDTWLLIDLKLGAVIRTKALLVVMTASVLSFLFWLIGLPYFLVVGAFAGIVEIVPVIGPLLACVAAVTVGLGVSWKLAAEAALVVYGLRIVQDYVINPRLFGRAVHLPPLAVLLAVSAVALLLGPWWVPLAIPLTAVAATLLEVSVLQVDPADKQVPTVLPLAPETVEARRRRPWDEVDVPKEIGRARST